MIFSSSYDGHYARDLARGFNQLGVGIAFISLSNPIKPAWIDTESKLDFSEGFNVQKTLFQKIIRTYNISRRYKPDVIQTHLFIGGIVGLIVGKLLRIPIVHTRHHIDEHYQSGTVLHRWLDRSIAKKSDHVVVCSAAAKKWLFEIEGIKESHITVINQGFDFSFLSPTSESIDKVKSNLGFSKDTFNIICVARYSKVKGQDYLLVALKELVEVIPNISLTFMGPGNSDWLAVLVSEFGLGKYVRILPSRNDVPACIAAADMIIHPSLADSFSQLVIEAQAVGGLLIASDIAAAREQIIDGITGLIVPPRDSQAIIDAVLYLVENPDLAASMRKKAQVHVRNTFTWQRMVEEEIECLSRHAD
jgi:glycosyltransferase involved in cell wall biosynthesis